MILEVIALAQMVGFDVIEGWGSSCFALRLCRAVGETEAWIFDFFNKFITLSYVASEKPTNMVYGRDSPD